MPLASPTETSLTNDRYIYSSYRKSDKYRFDKQPPIWIWIVTTETDERTTHTK